MKSSTSTSILHWNPCMVLSALLLLTACEQGQSLHFSPNSNQVRFESGRSVAEIKCLLDDDDLGNNGAFTWSGPARDNSAMMGHTSTSLESSGTVSTLTINNIVAGDAGQYSCSYAGAQVFITLVVVVEPAFLSVEQNQKFAAGTDAVVKCPANFGSNPPAEMRWTRNDESTLSRDLSVTSISDQFVPDNGVLRIQNVRVEDSGNYKCLLIRNGIVGEKTIQVEVLPQSEFAPKINDMVRKFEVVYDTNLTLPCKLVKSQENVTYSWTIDTEFEQDILKNTRAVLRRDARKFASGRYTCRAENKYGYDETDFIIRINAMPLPTQCTSVETTVLNNSNSTTVVLKSCDLTSPVQPSNLSYTWSRDGEPLTGTRFSVNQYGLLTIKNISQSDLGVYQVSISNAFGSADHTIKLVAASCTSAATSAAFTQSQRSQDLLVPLFLKFTLSRNHDGTSSSTGCTAVEEEAQGFIQQQILKEFGFVDVTIEDITVDCPFESKWLGTFAATLRGNRATQLSTLIKSKGISAFTLKSGQLVTVEVCSANGCSQEESAASEPWISRAGGVVIAVTAIAVMLAGLALLIVILICYRRRSFSKNGIDEEALYLAPPTNLEKKITKTKPAYYRSISVNLPIASSTAKNTMIN